MTTPTNLARAQEAMPELTNTELAKKHGAFLADLPGWNGNELPLLFPTQASFDAYTQAAIQQAAVAVPEGCRAVLIEPPEDLLETLCAINAPGVWPSDYGPTAQAIRREKAKATYSAVIATSTPVNRDQVHSDSGGSSGVTQWKITKWGNCPVCHRDRIPSEACAKNGCPDAPTSQINPGSAPRENGHGS